MGAHVSIAIVAYATPGLGDDMKPRPLKLTIIHELHAEFERTVGPAGLMVACKH